MAFHDTRFPDAIIRRARDGPEQRTQIDAMWSGAEGQRASWDGWARSVKRGTLEWIKTAKTDKTRATRIGDVVVSAAQGLRPSPFRR